MAGVNFVDAGVGAIFGELLKAVLDEIKKANFFKPFFEELGLTLRRIGPVIVEIEELDRQLDRSDDEIAMFTRQLQEGLDLVRKCAKVRREDYFWKGLCVKLEEFENSLLRWAQVNLQVRLSRNSSEMLLRLETNQKGGDNEIGYEDIEFVGRCGASGGPDFLVGLDEPVGELKVKLLDGGGEHVVVLSGPAGCGKTTLAKKLCSDEGIKGVFKDNIFFVTVSKPPKLMVIVMELFQCMDYPVPEFQTVEDAVNQLERMFKQLEADHILLVLDDVWLESEFLIETLEFNIPGFKILVTSRSKIGRFFNFELELLDDLDAMALFLHHSEFLQDGYSCIPNNLVKRIVKGCGGLPSALIEVGKSLRGKPVSIWNHRLMPEGQSIVRSNNQLPLCLRISVDALNEMEKEYFMDLAAFPRGQRIAVAALIDMWTELYNLNEDGEAAFSNLREFSCQNLVKLLIPWKDESEINGYYNEHYVMQHDRLRDIAIYGSEQSPSRLIMHIRGNDLSKIEQMQDTVHARFVSISTDGMFFGNWCNMQLPAVEVLVLNLQTRNYALPHSVEQMDRLRALIITNYGFCSAEISNFPLVGQLSSLKRIRLERISVSCFTNSILQLKNLRKLSLVMCKIDEAFQKCTIQIPNLMPNLLEIAVDYCNDLVKFPEWLCCVNSLQKLSITNCHEFISLPEGFGKLENLKVLRLQSCIKLSELPESVGSLQKLGFIDISDCISISKLPKRMGELCNLRKLNMRGCCGLSELPYSMKDLKQLEDLVCDDDTASLWEHYRTHLTNLRLKVLNDDADLDWLLGASKTIQASATYRSTLNILSQNFEVNLSTELESWPLRSDIALWKTKELSFTILMVATATWVALEVYQFVTLASWVVMFVVTSTFLWSNILRLFNREAGNKLHVTGVFGFRELPNLSGLEISEESAMKMSSLFRSWLEEIVRWIFRVGVGGDWFVFAGTVTALWLASLIGGCFDFLSLLYMGIVVGMSVPLIYVKCEDKIRKFGEKLRMQGKGLYIMFDEKVLGKMKSKVLLEKISVTKSETSMVIPNVDATVGAIFNELLTAVLHGIKKAKNFNSAFKRIEMTLGRIGAEIVEIEKLDRRLDQSDDEIVAFTRQLLQGLDLVRKCAEVRRLDCSTKNHYAKKLKASKRLLSQWAQIDVQNLLLRDSRKLLLMFDMNRQGATGGVCDDRIEFVRGCGAPGAPDFLVGFDEPLRELKAKLLDDGGEKVVVLSGLGGCGKTTLAKLLCSDEGITGIFKDNIFFVTVSKAPNLMVIVRELFQHMGYRVHEFQTVEDAINQLERMLKQLEADHILLVLDDVWPESKFPIETLEFDIPGYKILVTSRHKIDGFSNYELKLLDDHDAMVLFHHHSAFPQDGNSCIPDDLVKMTVRRCGGFPLALRVVGRSLRGKPVSVWNHWLTRWSERQSIVYSNNQLLLCLQTSIDALNEMDKEYYMDLAAFPEDQRIAVAALIDMWAELYELNEDGEGAFNKLYDFSCQNLVKLIRPRKDKSEINGYYNEHYVRLHDLLRDIAIYGCEQSPSRLIMHIRGNELSRIEQTQHTIHARFVSISTDERFSRNWCNMQLPAVEVLVLNIQTGNYALPHSVEQMYQLKALIITNYSFWSAEISNFPLVGQLSSLKRIRLERISVFCITNSILQLKNLRKLSLVLCKIGKAFQECTIQIPNLMPNLGEIAIDNCTGLVKFPEWLCYASSLRKLSITNCHEFISLPEGFGKLGNLEVLRLQSCISLSGLPESVASIQKLGFLDISDCISISQLPERMGELCNLRELNMRGCCGLFELPYSVKDLKQLEDLICDDETAALWEHYRTHFTNLRLKVNSDDAYLDWLHGFALA